MSAAGEKRVFFENSGAREGKFRPNVTTGRRGIRELTRRAREERAASTCAARAEQGSTIRAGDKMYWNEYDEGKYSEAHLETRGRN